MLSERLVVCRGGGLQGLVYALLDLIRYVKSELGRLSGNKENVQRIPAAGICANYPQIAHFLPCA